MAGRAEHYSGTYWSATDDRHVIYESRLDLARVLFADFDRSVHRICAQPFLLAKRSNGVERKHIPDYLLIDGSRTFSKLMTVPVAATR